MRDTPASLYFPPERIKPEHRASDGLGYQLKIGIGKDGSLDARVWDLYSHSRPGETDARQEDVACRTYEGLSRDVAFAQSSALYDRPEETERAEMSWQVERAYSAGGIEEATRVFETLAQGRSADDIHNAYLASSERFLASLNDLLVVPGSEGVQLERVADKEYLFGHAWKPRGESR